MMNPVLIDVIYPLPEGWGMCLTCEMVMARADLDQGPYQRGLDEYPPEWQEEFTRLSNLIIDLSGRYQDQILIRIWDPRSLQGLWKAIRHRVSRYPAFIFDGSKKVTGWDNDLLEKTLQLALAGSHAA